MTIRELKEKLLTEEKHDCTSLAELVEVLRSPEGCPWDREQDHRSIRTDFIEETYEAVEAIDKGDTDLLKEELGDVLLQVVFHAEIEREKGAFTMDDVTDGIVSKMIYRHPHVFGDVKVSGSSEVLENWDKLKSAEKSRNTLRSVLEAVPKQYPALIRAKKVAKKAAKAGYVFGAEDEQIAEIGKLAASLGEAENREALLTELIFRAVVLAGADADVEKDLGDRVDSFIEQFPEEEKEGERNETR